MLGFRIWAVKNSQKRRSARGEGEKSTGAAVRCAGRAGRSGAFDGMRLGNMGGGL